MEAVSGDELWVEAGVYTPGSNAANTFGLRAGIALYGGFAGTETSRAQRNWKTNVTTLSGDIGTAGDNTDNSWHVVTSDSDQIGATTVLDGFTVTGGNATGDSSWNAGGGLLVKWGSPTVANCTFSANSSPSDGGAVFCNSSSTPSFTRCTFTGNSAQTGGALFAGTDLTLDACSFQNNSATSAGGALRLASGTALAPTINRCTFVGNTAVQAGGAISLTRAAATIANSTFSGNSAGSTGSGIGGAISYDKSGGLVVNCTLAGNTAGSEGGAIFSSAIGATGPTVTNSILWANAPEQVTNQAPSVVTLNSSVVQGGCSWGSACNGIVTADPKLGVLGKYGGHGKTILLNFGSSAIDAGDDAVCAAAPVSGASQNGLSRPQGKHCDIGALEIGRASLRSTGTSDGWVLESTENSSVGGSLNRTDANLFLGDDGANRQYRSVVAFDTASLPDGAKASFAALRLHRAGQAGADPLTTHGDLAFDMRRGGFSGSNALQTTDFQAPASLMAAGKVPKTASGGWYTAVLSTAARAVVNPTGQTQFRLRFAKDDNNDKGADLLKLHSGEAALDARPALTLLYYVP